MYEHTHTHTHTHTQVHAYTHTPTNIWGSARHGTCLIYKSARRSQEICLTRCHPRHSPVAGKYKSKQTPTSAARLEWWTITGPWSAQDRLHLKSERACLQQYRMHISKKQTKCGPSIGWLSDSSSKGGLLTNFLGKSQLAGVSSSGIGCGRLGRTETVDLQLHSVWLGAVWLHIHLFSLVGGQICYNYRCHYRCYRSHHCHYCHLVFFHRTKQLTN